MFNIFDHFQINNESKPIDPSMIKILINDRLTICRGLPCGVQPPEPVPDPDGDKLATIAARFSYFQERKSTLTAAKVDLRRNINPPARYKNARPTVRLRPRQVLCSKCRSICNENSENVDVSRKRKHDEIQQEQQQPQQQQVIFPSYCETDKRRTSMECCNIFIFTISVLLFVNMFVKSIGLVLFSQYSSFFDPFVIIIVNIQHIWL